MVFQIMLLQFNNRKYLEKQVKDLYHCIVFIMTLYIDVIIMHNYLHKYKNHLFKLILLLLLALLKKIYITWCIYNV